MVSLWAWTTNPSAVPKVMWSTIYDRPGRMPIGSATPAAQGLDGLEDRVLIHLDILEDFSLDAAANVPQSARRQAYEWDKGIIGGERQPRESHSSPASRGTCQRRDDDHEDRNGRRDDDDQRGRQDDRGSWAGRIFRSRSRAAGDRRGGGGRHEDQRRDDQRRRDDRRGDRHDGRDGRRRQGGAPTAAECVAALVQTARLGGATVADVALAQTAEAGRGRAASRHPSPRSVRSHASDNLTPPASPPLTPTSVLPAPMSSRRADDRSAEAVAAMVARVAAASPVVASLCSPACLSLSSPSPSHPLGLGTHQRLLSSLQQHQGHRWLLPGRASFLLAWSLCLCPGRRHCSRLLLPLRSKLLPGGAKLLQG